MIDGERQAGRSRGTAGRKAQSAGGHAPQDKSRSEVEVNQGNGSKMRTLGMLETETMIQWAKAQIIDE